MATEFNPRSAIRSRAETMAQRKANADGKPAIVYQVNGGYEVRAADGEPPRNAHLALVTIQPQELPMPAPPADDVDPATRPHKGKGKGGRS